MSNCEQLEELEVLESIYPEEYHHDGEDESGRTKFSILLLPNGNDSYGEWEAFFCS